MKDNSRNRRLLYIREKNKIRSGIAQVVTFIKVDNSVLINSKERFDELVRKEVLINSTYLRQKWKLPFYLSEVRTGIANDDFLHDLGTIVFYFKPSNLTSTRPPRK